MNKIVLMITSVIIVAIAMTAQSFAATTTKMSLKSARLVGLEQCQGRFKTPETNVLAQLPSDLCAKMSVGDELTDLEMDIVPTIAPPEVEISGDLHLVKATSKKLGALSTAQ